jgi:hypothetical protein
MNNPAGLLKIKHRSVFSAAPSKIITVANRISSASRDENLVIKKSKASTVSDRIRIISLDRCRVKLDFFIKENLPFSSFRRVVCTCKKETIGKVRSLVHQDIGALLKSGNCGCN